MDLGLTKADLTTLLANVDQLSEAELVAVTQQLDELERREAQKAKQDDLIEFCKHMQEDYKVGAHHRRLADLLMNIETREKDRICVSVPPRHGKSQMVSIFYAAWYLGRNPGHKVMLVSHTTDLAVDFGRKVRNVIGSSTFQEVFPGVTLASDSKSAGRWSTNYGGEFFACISPDTIVVSDQGIVRAADVKPGMKLRSASGYQDVTSVMETSHSTTVHVAGGVYSSDHPIWTMDAGWVSAESISPHNVLCSESILDIMQARLWRIYHGLMEYTGISEMVQHQEPVPEPEQREVPKLRRAWDYARSAMGRFPHLLCGYGRPALSTTYSGPDRQQRAVFPGELSLGDPAGAEQQQAHERVYRGEDAGAACAVLGIDPRGTAVSDVSRIIGGASVDPGEEAQTALQDYRPPDGLGWARRCAAWLLTRSSREYNAGSSGASPESNMARLRGATQNLLGLLVGVRYAGDVQVETHEPRTFVNFRVSGDNTFFSAGVLTHNCGVGSALAGRGAHLLLIDDPHSEQDILNGNFDVFDKAYEWFTFGARTRLMPGGAVAIVHTRWHLDDLIGRVVRDMTKNPGADQYEVFEFPAILESTDEDGNPAEKALWPEFFDLEALHRTKASMPLYQWNAQYQQNPTSEEAALVKRDWWQIWKGDSPPPCEYVISSLDAAAEKNNRADYTALTTWGVFYNEKTGANELILLNSIKDRFEFPELKQLCLDHWREWQPDSFIVEKKSAGVAIYQELRRMGIPLQEYTPHRGTGDKYARLNSVADIIASRMVHVPEKRWADELVEEVAAFPFGSHDDLVDSTVMALMRFRQGGFLRLPTDEPEEPIPYRHKREYY